MIVALGGKKRCGKDTAAKALIEHGFTRLSFADELKNICARVYGLQPEMFHIDELKDRSLPVTVLVGPHHLDAIREEIDVYYPITEAQMGYLQMNFLYKTLDTPREILQFTGMFLRDSIDENFFVNIILDKLEHIHNAVITDMRMPNERQALRIAGATLGLILRPNFVADRDEHVTENSFGELEEYNFVLYNDSTIEDLQKGLKKMVIFDRVNK